MALPYSKRYATFADSPATTSAIDAQFLNAVEAALIALCNATPSNNNVLAYNSGSGQFAPATITNAMVDAAAAIVFSKLAGYPADATKFARGDGTWAVPASGGAEVGYDQITAPVNVVSTTEATGTSIIACAAHVFDGAPVIATLSIPGLKMDTAAAGDLMIVSLFEGATQIGRFFAAQTPSITSQMIFPGGTWQLRFTPTAASHTYTVTAKVTSATGTPQVLAGVGGTADYFAAFVRFTKV